MEVRLTSVFPLTFKEDIRNEEKICMGHITYACIGGVVAAHLHL